MGTQRRLSRGILTARGDDPSAASSGVFVLHLDHPGPPPIYSVDGLQLLPGMALQVRTSRNVWRNAVFRYPSTLALTIYDGPERARVLIPAQPDLLCRWRPPRAA